MAAGGQRVLLIEGSADDRRLIEGLLARRWPGQLSVTEAPTLREGLEQLAGGAFDLVLLDHTHPDLSSLDELRAVRQVNREVPIILHSGYIGDGVREQAMQLDAHEVVSKELDMSRLASAIERALRGEAGLRVDPTHVADILVVEDNEVVRRMMAVSLELAGHTVRQACDGEAALEILGESGRRLDLVVADVLMPRLAGGELVEQLRQRRNDVPVLFVSGTPASELLRQGRLPAGAKLLAMPFTPEALVQAVAEILPARR
jgi:CheY-like chemotaxis protein